MPWRFEMDRYSMEARLSEQPRGTSTISIHENGREIHSETLQIQPGENALMFHGRVWPRIWELQDQFRPRAQQEMLAERERQLREG